ncbi:MAG: hypothetical protein AB7P07_13745 [Hyphomonadaceae bacterium]
MRHLKIGLAAAAAVIGLTALPAQAQISAYVGSMMDALRAEMLRREVSAPGNEGATYFHGEVGSLNDDENRQAHLISNWGGGVVTVTGFCDSDCSDLDLFVVDDAGNEIVSDVSIDTTPVVTFTPDASRAYELRVRMYQCNTNPCFYSVGAFYRSY